jgi:hypothetical protein
MSRVDNDPADEIDSEIISAAAQVPQRDVLHTQFLLGPIVVALARRVIELDHRLSEVENDVDD